MTGKQAKADLKRTQRAIASTARGRRVKAQQDKKEQAKKTAKGRGW